MNTDDIVERARERCGRNDFHSESFREGLDIVVEEVNSSPQSPERERRIANECARALMSRLRVDDWMVSAPDVAADAVHRPVFVIGMPRTGSTILVNLMGQDRESCRVMWNWEVDHPTPPVEPAALLDDPRIAAKTAKLAPVLEKLRYFPRMELATDPVECVHILAQDFKSLTWHTSTGSSRFNAWLLDHADLRSAYTHHRRTLQVLQSGGAAGQWILKLPSHALHLEALLSVYPDARLVITHRDPLPSLVSMCSYAAMIHRANDNRVELQELVSATWRQVFESAIRTVDFVAAHPEVPTYHIYQSELADDPIEQVSRLRSWIGLGRHDDLEARMHDYLTNEWPHPPGSHRYTASDFAITRAAVNEAFAPYIDTFTVPLERA
jgi:Sulfotransferase family